MDFRELNYILAIARYQNITKASESLYVSQPTLSKFLKNLEEEIGTPLFKRLGYKYQLTYAGECYVEKAHEILRLKHELDAELADIQKEQRGVLKVGFPSMRCTYMLPGILPAFQELHPNINVEVHEGHSVVLDQKLLNGEIDLAFYTQRSEDSDPLIEYQVLAEEELLICMQKGHPLMSHAVQDPESRYPTLDLKYLENERAIMLSEKQRTRQITDHALAKAGITLSHIIVTSNMSAIMDLAACGYGISFLFESHLKHHTGAPVDCCRIGKKGITANFVAAKRKGTYIPACSEDFIRMAEELTISA